MPYCPVCRYEYVKSMTTCPDCDVNLVDELPEEIVEEEHEPEIINEETVAIYTAEAGLEASIIRGILDEAGIPVKVKGDVRALFYLGKLDDDVIEVPVSRAEEAKKLIEEAMASGSIMPEEEIEDTES